MKIKVTDYPIGHKFSPDVPYHVYGFGLRRDFSMAYVFDDDCESCFLSELEYEEFTNET